MNSAGSHRCKSITMKRISKCNDRSTLLSLLKKYCNATLIPTSTAVEPLSEYFCWFLAKSQVVSPKTMAGS
jgi:hypothetical protein